MVSDKKIHRAFRAQEYKFQLYYQKKKTIREMFHFHHLPKLYIGFK